VDDTDGELLRILKHFAVPGEFAEDFITSLIAHQDSLAFARQMETPISFVTASVGHRKDWAMDLFHLSIRS
jgi:hypothetical protein